MFLISMVEETGIPDKNSIFQSVEKRCLGARWRPIASPWMSASNHFGCKKMNVETLWAVLIHAVPVLRVLNNEDHKEGEGCPGVDNEPQAPIRRMDTSRKFLPQRCRPKTGGLCLPAGS
jgi:hypothetical protein